MNLYDILGVSADATDAVIKAAHRRAAKEHHPDKPGGDRAKFDEIQKAYEVLKDPARRARYDETGDTEVNDPEAIAAREAARFVSELIQSAVDHIEDVEFTDILDACRRQISDRKAQLADTREAAVAADKRAEKMLSRIALVEGAEDDPIRSALTAKRNKIADMVKQMDGAAGILERASETFGSYTYRTDKRPTPEPGAGLTVEQFDEIFFRFGGPRR